MESKEKLKELALQLGESCLACDFTSLINQKRDYEIEKYKKKITVKRIKIKRMRILMMRTQINIIMEKTKIYQNEII